MIASAYTYGQLSWIFDVTQLAAGGQRTRWGGAGQARSMLHRRSAESPLWKEWDSPAKVPG